MMKEAKTYTHDFVVFPRKLYIAFGSTPKEISSMLDGTFFDTTTGNKVQVAGVGNVASTLKVTKLTDTSRGVGDYGYMFLMVQKPTDMSEASIAQIASHEAAHIAVMLCADCGIQCSDDDSEAFAYILSTVTKWIVQDIVSYWQ